MYFESDGDAVDTLNRFGNDTDLNPKWPGLTTNLLLDIYSVHKARCFGQLTFTNYPKSQYIEDIQKSEQSIFAEAICSPIIKENESAFNLSFYPSFVINDDIFEVMSLQFAVSSLVNGLNQNDAKSNGLSIRSIVIPASITSIYDSEEEYKSGIEHIADYLDSISPSNPHLRCTIKPNTKDIPSMTQSLSKMFQFVVQNASTGDIVIVFNRQNGLDSFSIFECNDSAELMDLYRNYFIGFDYNVEWTPNDEQDDDHRRVRCWMTFGINQRLRFYPEHLVWIAPRLFTRSTAMTAKERVERLYGADYKWGWRVTLDDPVFDRYHHIITQHVHVTNNYNRDHLKEDSDDESKEELADRLLRDYLEETVKWELAMTLRPVVDDQFYDSDAILEDMENIRDSNIAVLHGLDDGDLRILKFAVLKFQNISCSMDSIKVADDVTVDDEFVPLPINKRPKDDDVNEEAATGPPSLEYGVSVLRWLSFGISSRFGSLRDEFVMNPDSTIHSAIYNELRKEAAAKAKGIDYTVDEMLALRAVSHDNHLSEALTRAHWKTASQKTLRTFYHWAMTLYRVHLRNAVPMAPKPPMYIGFKALFILEHDMGFYFGPLSTSTSKDTAVSFAGNYGQILKIGSSQVNPMKRVLGIPMKDISSSPNEGEVMVYHSLLPIKETELLEDDSMVLMNHLLFSLLSRRSPIINRNAFFGRLGVRFDVEWIPLIFTNPMLYSVTKCMRMTIIERLGTELGIEIFALQPLLGSALFVDEDNNVKLRERAHAKISPQLLSSYVIAVSSGFEIDDEFVFESADQFIIPNDLLAEKYKDSDGPIDLSILVKPKDGSLGGFLPVHQVAWSSSKR